MGNILQDNTLTHTLIGLIRTLLQANNSDVGSLYVESS
jgi:hypothetical protein